MYGFPKDLDVQRFVGLSVAAITFGGYSLYVQLTVGNAMPSNEEQRITLSITSSVRHYLPADDAWETLEAEEPFSATSLPAVVGRRVDAAVVENTGDLALTLDDGQVLLIDEQDIPYESYIIDVDGRQFVV